MSDDLVVASTTDTPEQMQAALEHGLEPDHTEGVLSTIDRETGDVVEDAPVVDEKAPEKPTADAATDEQPIKAGVEEPVKGDEKPVKVEAKAGKTAAPVRADYKTDEEYLGAAAAHLAQKRIGKLTFQAREAERQAEVLRAENEALKAGQKAPPAADVVEDEPAPADEVKTIETKIQSLGPRPKLEDFETTEAWETAFAEYTDKKGMLQAELVVAQRVVKEETADAEATSREKAAKDLQVFKDSYVEAKNRYDDFEEVVNDPSIQLTGTMQMRIIQQAKTIGHDLAYYFATHRDEAEAIYAMGDTPEALLEIGGIERELRKAVRAVSGGEPAKPKVAPRLTKTPEPIEPVGGHGVTTQIPLEKMTQEQYKAHMNKLEAQKRRLRH